jgi:ABC-type molybdate transport system permease subunit
VNKLARRNYVLLVIALPILTSSIIMGLALAFYLLELQLVLEAMLISLLLALAAFAYSLVLTLIAYVLLKRNYPYSTVAFYIFIAFCCFLIPAILGYLALAFLFVLGCVLGGCV